MATRPIIKDCLSFLNFCGGNPLNQNQWSKVKAVAAVFLVTHMAIELLLKFLFNEKSSRSMEPLGEFGAISSALCKLYVVLRKKKDFIGILAHIQQFWTGESLEDDSQRKIRRTLFQSGTRVIKLFNIFTLVTASMFFVKPLFMTTRTLPLDWYHPVDRMTPYYQLSYAMQCIAICFAYSGTVGFDGLFFAFIIHIACELKALKQKLSTINVGSDVKGDDEDCLRKIGQLVHHHNLVLKCIKNLNQLYAEFLLLQSFCSILLICTALFLVAAGGFPPDLREMSNSLPYLLSASLQLFVYCLGGTYLITESESVADGVYESDWWVKTQPKFRRACVLIIQRANKAEYLTAGGMFILNLQTFTKMMRLALSFYSVTQATYSKKEWMEVTPNE